MLYDRKIKYVDYCENGERVKGGGFVKLEVRDGFLKMDLHIKGLYPTDSFVRDVVLSGSEAEAVLGQITLHEGVGSFSYSCGMTEGIGSTGISYEDLREIKIPVGGSRELSCTWEKIADKAAKPLGTEGLERESPQPESAGSESSKSEGMAEASPIARGEGAKFQETEGQGIEARKIEARKTEAQEAEARKTEARKTEAQEAEARKTEAQEAETQKTEARKTKTQETDVREEAGETGVLEAVASEIVPQQVVPEPASREIAAQEPAAQTAELQQAGVLESGSIGTKNDASLPEHQNPTSKVVDERNEKPPSEPQTSEGGGQQETKNEPKQKPAVKLLEDKWQQLSAIYPHIRPFKDEREYLSLNPSDFVLFPESYYRAANNSFLLHGFYNYKHLILARVERRSEVRYYLGVPGNYYEREKQVAVMFGFESFECDREPAKTGDFGYYLMRMEL